MPPQYPPPPPDSGYRGPPQYKQYQPLPVTDYAGLPSGIFNIPPVDYQAKIRAREALEAQQLNQQAVQLSVAERQRQAAMEKAQAEALMAQFGGANAGQPFDGDAALQTAQRIAAQHGDLDGMLAIEKATRDRSAGAAAYPLGEAEAEAMGVEPGTPANIARLILLERQRQDTERMRNDPTRVRNRELDATLKQQRSTGTQIRPATPAMAAKVGAARSFVAQMDDIENYYTPYVSENRGERFLALLANPNSAAYRLNKELTLAAKNAALALEDRVTDQDYKTIADIVTINNLDTMETVLDKMFRLKEFIARRTNADLEAAEAGGFNVAGLKQLSGLSAPPETLAGQPQPSPSGASVSQAPQDRSGLTPEQRAKVEAIKARLTTGQGG